MEIIERLTDNILRALEPLSMKDDLTPNEICWVKDAMKALVCAEEYEAMKGTYSDYYSNRRSMGNDGYSTSYARGRDMQTGRYISRDSNYGTRESNNYSRHSDKQAFKDYIQNRLHNVRNDEEAETLERAMGIIDRMP